MISSTVLALARTQGDQVSSRVSRRRQPTQSAARSSTSEHRSETATLQGFNSTVRNQRQGLGHLYVRSYPDVHLFTLNFGFVRTDRGRLPPIMVRIEQMADMIIPVGDNNVTSINEWFSSAKRQSGVIQKAAGDTSIEKRVLAGRRFLLDNMVELCLLLS